MQLLEYPCRCFFFRYWKIFQCWVSPIIRVTVEWKWMASCTSFPKFKYIYVHKTKKAVPHFQVSEASNGTQEIWEGSWREAPQLVAQFIGLKAINSSGMTDLTNWNRMKYIEISNILTIMNCWIWKKVSIKRNQFNVIWDHVSNSLRNHLISMSYEHNQ